MADIECEHCGGTDFYKEAGFFFCKGCQIQSQEVQEYAFEEFTGGQRITSKKLQTEKKDKTLSKITSWECYNYILLGLTEELISLGADKRLKVVVKSLWLCYLERMKVFKMGEDQMPKLQAVSSEVDAEIVYGKLAKRKRARRKSSSSEATSLDSSSMKRERIKRKRALVKAQYDEFSQKSQGTPSLHNETLTSLQTGSEKSSKRSSSIRYNIYAVREMRRLEKSKYHWHKHGLDFQHILKCHKMSYRKISHRYRESPYILSLNKLYSILYIGLLILKDKIQLSDILRFIREGKLSFNYYSHFFPEDFDDKDLNFRNFKKNSVFANTPFRTLTSEMSIFLQVQYYITCPNLIELSERYCKELNLPQIICKCVKHILASTNVRMSYRKRFAKVPNYEGRVLSIILFVIKLLFGLDDVTEFYLGQYAEILNRSDFINPKMFNVVRWLKYIEYRDLVMSEEHFPTSFSRDTDVNVNLAIGHISKKEYTDPKYNETKDCMKHLLTKLKYEIHEPEQSEYPTSLTPFLDFVKVLPKTKYLDILLENSSDYSLDHILKPSQYIEMVNKNGKLEVVHGGANEKWVVEKLTCFQQQQHESFKEKRKLVTVKLNFGSNSKTQSKQREPTIDSDEIKKNFHTANEDKFKENQLRCRQSIHITDLDLKKLKKDLGVSLGEYPRHYNPHERFWMRTKVGIEATSQKDCRKFLEKFPYNFRLVFKECQRIAQQNEHELLTEYQMTELHLVYLANSGKKTRRQEIMIDRLIAKRLNKFVDLW